MKNEMASVAIIHILSVIKISSDIQKLMEGHRETDSMVIS
jgi:hypothetical protein